MALNIKPTTKEVPSRKGRPTSPEIEALRAFIMTSLESGQTQVWTDGAADDTMKDSNTSKLRAQAALLNSERAKEDKPKFKMSVGTEGADIYFRATPRTEGDSEDEGEPEPQPEAAKPRKAAKATAGAK